MNAKKVHLVKGQFVDYILHQNSETQSINSTKSIVRMLVTYSETVNTYLDQISVVFEHLTNLYSKQFILQNASENLVILSHYLRSFRRYPSL